MREDYQEKLEKMFPGGYMILYTCNNDTLRFQMYNPNDYSEIYKVAAHIIKTKEPL